MARPAQGLDGSEVFPPTLENIYASVWASEVAGRHAHAQTPQFISKFAVAKEAEHHGRIKEELKKALCAGICLQIISSHALQPLPVVQRVTGEAGVWPPPECQGRRTLHPALLVSRQYPPTWLEAPALLWEPPPPARAKRHFWVRPQ